MRLISQGSPKPTTPPYPLNRTTAPRQSQRFGHQRVASTVSPDRSQGSMLEPCATTVNKAMRRAATSPPAAISRPAITAYTPTCLTSSTRRWLDEWEKSIPNPPLFLSMPDS
jgi:hypothetical protein